MGVHIYTNHSSQDIDGDISMHEAPPLGTVSILFYLMLCVPIHYTNHVCQDIDGDIGMPDAPSFEIVSIIF